MRRIFRTHRARSGAVRVRPHRLRHTYGTELEGRGVASDATFGSSREHALPAAQRTALGALSVPGRRRGRGDLGRHRPPGPDATMLHLMPLRDMHPCCVYCRHRASGPPGCIGCIAGGPGEPRRPALTATRSAPGLGSLLPHAPDLATGRCGCTGCITAPERLTAGWPRLSCRPHGTLTHRQAADAPGTPCGRRPPRSPGLDRLRPLHG